MEYCHTETPHPTNQFKQADRWIKLQETQLPLDVAQHCSILVFPLQKFQCWKFLNVLFYEIKLFLPDLSLSWSIWFENHSPWTAWSRPAPRRQNISFGIDHTARNIDHVWIQLLYWRSDCLVESRFQDKILPANFTGGGGAYVLLIKIQWRSLCLWIPV